MTHHIVVERGAAAESARSCHGLRVHAATSETFRLGALSRARCDVVVVAAIAIEVNVGTPSPIFVDAGANSCFPSLLRRSCARATDGAASPSHAVAQDVVWRALDFEHLRYGARQHLVEA